LILGDNCGTAGYEENSKEEEEFKPEKKRQQLVDGAYRIIFNNENQNKYHTKTNVRDKSIDNFHGDAIPVFSMGEGVTAGGAGLGAFSGGMGPGMVSQNVPSFRTPAPNKSAKLGENHTGSIRPPSGYKSNNNSASGSNTNLPRIDSRNIQRPKPGENIQMNRRPPSGLIRNRQD
jgi:hypothetical protein